jgi:hypothetical protein
MGRMSRKREVERVNDCVLESGARTKTPKQITVLGQNAGENSILSNFELFPNQLTKRIFDFWVPRNRSVSIRSWISVNIVLPSMAFQITTRAGQLPNEFFPFQVEIPNSRVLTVQRGTDERSSLNIMWYASAIFAFNSSTVFPWLNTPGTSRSFPTYISPCFQYSSVNSLFVLLLGIFLTVAFTLRLIYTTRTGLSIKRLSFTSILHAQRSLAAHLLSAHLNKYAHSSFLTDVPS